MAHFDNYSNITLRKYLISFLSTKVQMLQISELFRTQIPPDVLHVPRGGSHRCGSLGCIPAARGQHPYGELREICGDAARHGDVIA